jgi:competence protein ComEC
VLFFIVVIIHIYKTPIKLEVNFLDVGQGDASLIKVPTGQIILIDGGPDNKILRRLGEILPFYRRQIDFIIISHYHDDHTTGLAEIIKRYKVKKLIYAAREESSATLQEILMIAKDKDIRIYVLNDQVKIPFNNECFLNLLNPIILGIKADSNNSLVTKLDCERQKYLFTGDNSLTVEKALINSGWDLKADVLKAAHHGSDSANGELFLEATSPEIMVISVGADNKFNHPNPKVLERAEKIGLNIKRTDKEGNIKLISQ